MAINALTIYSHDSNFSAFEAPFFEGDFSELPLDFVQGVLKPEYNAMYSTTLTLLQ